MITPLLEKLILERKAVFKTFNHGASGVGTLPNPNNRTIIITKIIYHPFLDYNDNIANYPTFANFIANYSHFIHTLRLVSKENVADWTFRDSFNLIRDNGEMFLTPAEPVIIDTYFTANENVQISIFGFTNIQDLLPTIDGCPIKSVQPTYPQGYGVDGDPVFLTSIQVLKSDNQNGVTEYYYPLGKKSGINIANEARFNFAANERIAQLDGGSFDRDFLKFPMITFQYVELLDKYSASSITKK